MDKIWLDNYQDGVPHEIDNEVEKYNSLGELFDKKCNEFADLVAYSNFGTDITYDELHQKAIAFGSYLQQELKLKKGDRIAIMSPNILQYPIALFGALKAGLVVVNINPLYTPRELLYQVDNAKIETILVLENFAKTVEKVLHKSSLKNIIITRFGDLHKNPKRLLLNFINKYIRKNVTTYHIHGYIKFLDILNSGSNLNFKEPDVKSSDYAFIQYTGGTTGVSKGAILSHKNLLANLQQIVAWVKPSIKPGRETVITPLPLYHIFSLTGNCLTFIYMGARNILITNPRDINSFIRELKGVKFSVITGVNTLFNALLSHKDFHHLDFSELKLSLGGGMAIQKAAAEKWHKITNCPLLEAYGLTETSPAVTINPMDLKKYNGSIGLPLPSTLITIRDKDNNKVDIGKPGELWVKGPQVMKEYWRQPQENSSAFSDEWFKTGDMAYIDDYGYIYIVDRIKDIILVSGFNIYPNEVEDVLVSHQYVNEAGVIGIKDKNKNENVVAYVSLNNKNITELELQDYCRSHLARYKVPKKIIFTDELPKTSVGKISRKDLKELAKSTIT